MTARRQLGLGGMSAIRADYDLPMEDPVKLTLTVHAAKMFILAACNKPKWPQRTVGHEPDRVSFIYT